MNYNQITEQHYYEEEEYVKKHGALEQGLHNRPEVYKENDAWGKVNSGMRNVTNTGGNRTVWKGW